MDKSIGDLIDSLSVTNIKIYHLVDVVEDSKDDKVVAEAARKTAKLNRYRSELVNAIDKKLEGKEGIVKT